METVFFNPRPRQIQSTLISADIIIKSSWFQYVTLSSLSWSAIARIKTMDILEFYLKDKFLFSTGLQGMFTTEGSEM